MIDTKIIKFLNKMTDEYIAPELKNYDFDKDYSRSGAYRITEKKNQNYLIEIKVRITKEKKEEK